MPTHTLTGIGLCAGVGWLDIAVKLAWQWFGVEYRTVAFAERDIAAAAVLVARMGDSSLEQAFVFDGIEDIGDEFRGVDCLAAGFPCQPWSVAGQQLGTDDARWIWDDILGCLDRTGAKWLFLENVPGLCSGAPERQVVDGAEVAVRTDGLDSVLRSLADRGFDAEWCHLSASEVGASHRRNRWFCVAKRMADTGGKRRQQNAGSSSSDEGANEGRSAQHDYELAGCVPDLADSVGGGLGELRESSSCDGQLDGSDGDVGHTEHSQTGNGIAGAQVGKEGGKRRRMQRSIDASGVLADTDGSGRRPQSNRREQDRSDSAGGEMVHAASQRAQVAEGVSCGTGEGIQQLDGRDCNVADSNEQGPQERRSVGPDDGSELATTERNCLPLFAPGPTSELWRDVPEWLWPAISKEAAQSQFRRMANGSYAGMDDPRADRLRCIGNGVVILQAAAAFARLIARMN